MSNYDSVPVVEETDIWRIILRDFPSSVPSEIWAIVSEGNQSFRVVAAALKLSKGRIERLKEEMLAANRDYRDILAAAEYPTQFRCCPPAKATEEMKRADKQQYEEWFNK